jgi:hypothetical protein
MMHAPTVHLQLPPGAPHSNDEAGGGEHMSNAWVAGGGAGAAQHQNPGVGSASAAGTHTPLAAEPSDELRGARATMALEASTGRGSNHVSAHAASTSHALPQAFLGRKVRREFVQGWFMGTVDATRHAAGQQWWHVRYDDGDSEELDHASLLSCMLPLDAAGASVAAAAVVAAAAPPVASSGDAAARRAEGASSFLGVRKCRSGKSFQAQLYVPGGKTVNLGYGFATAEAAARAHDAEARKRGMLHRINFPVNDAERAAAEEYRRLGANTSRAARHMGVAWRQAASKRARPEGGEDAAADDDDGGDDAGGAGTAAGSAPVSDEVAQVQAFLRAISPPLSQARPLLFFIHASSNAHRHPLCSDHSHTHRLRTQLDAALAAVPGSGLTLTQLAGVTSMAAELRDAWLKEVTAGLRIGDRLGDRLAFLDALDKLTRAACASHT